MKVNQITTTLEKTMKQVFGEEAITGTDLTSLVQLGNKLIADSNADVFDAIYKALLDRVYMIEYERVYKREDTGLTVSYPTFGAILEKVYVEMPESKSNKTWDIQNADPNAPTLSDVKVKIFSDINTWEVPYTIMDRQIKSAFNGDGEMSAFITNQFNKCTQSMEARVEAVEQWTRLNYIASKIHFASANIDTGVHEVKLVTMYNSEFGTDLSPAQALILPDWYKYASMVISTYIKKMRPITSVFNTESWKRFTPEDEVRLHLLTDFEKRASYFMQSGVFHDEIVKLPTYTSVPFWQGSGKNYSFTDCSHVNITTSDGNAVDKGNVLGVLFDTRAMGVSIWNQRITSQYNGHGEFNNYWIKADIGLYNDLSENGIVFVAE